MTIFFVTSTILGFILLFWIKKRKFKRTNKYGVEEYKSLTGKLITTPFEKFVWILGVLLIISGILLAISSEPYISLFDVEKICGHK